ncbi:MAG: hypothetical protein RLY31_1228, partial [Bacteroidota bacterium]
MYSQWDDGIALPLRGIDQDDNFTIYFANEGNFFV